MRVSIVDNPRRPLFDRRSESGRLLVRCVLAAAAFALGAGLLLGGLGTDPAVGAEVAGRPSLRSVVAVRSDIVTVGDFFENAGEKAAVPLFRSPDLGTTGTVSARRVVELAQAAGVERIDADGLVEVTVSRLARTVEADEIARIVAAAVLHQPGRATEDIGIDDLRVAFDGTVDPQHADLRAATPIRVASLSLSPQSGRFDALLLVDRGETTDRLRLRGEVIETAPAITLTRPLNRGEVVGRDDVQIERLSRRLVGNRRALDPSDVIGMAARKALRPGQPIAIADFVRPNVVSRGDLVTIVFETANLTITGRGQAQEAGTVGDLVTVINPQSKRTLHATVLGPGRVGVVSPASSVASLAKVDQ
jgi:flagella basal body P-ring formation protein FlgA